MKKLCFLFCFLNSIFLFGQSKTTVLEKKIERKASRLQYKFDSVFLYKEYNTNFLRSEYLQCVIYCKSEKSSRIYYFGRNYSKVKKALIKKLEGDIDLKNLLDSNVMKVNLDENFVIDHKSSIVYFRIGTKNSNATYKFYEVDLQQDKYSFAYEFYRRFLYFIEINDIKLDSPNFDIKLNK